MASLSSTALLQVTGRVCQKTFSRHASRITKFKSPHVGGIYKWDQLPYRPREEDEYAAEGESLYPEIPGEYPPGVWGKMDHDRAWKFYERSQELLKIGSLRERLYDLTKVTVTTIEKNASKETMKHWLIEPNREWPYFFPFLQYITKTRLHHSLPAETLEPSPLVNHERLKKCVQEKVSLLDAKRASVEQRVAAIVEAVNAELQATHRLEHLVEGQMERDVTFEAAWRRCGFEEDDMEDDLPRTKDWNKKFGCYSPVGGYSHADRGIINFQGRATPFLSLRSKYPLKTYAEEAALAVKEDIETAGATDLSVTPFVHDWVVNDAHSIPLYAYHPSLYGLKSSVAAPTLNAGFNLPPVYHKDWIQADKNKFFLKKISNWNAMSDRGAIRRTVKHHSETYHPGVESDPRGFPHTAFALPVDQRGVDALGYSFGGDEDPLQIQQWDAERMLTTLFTWNVASAYYQGFCCYLDLTYPMASQGVLTDGRTWQFYSLRTDTMEIWRDDDAYLPGSAMWMSRKMKLEEEADLILTILTNFMGRETRKDMSAEELRPYVTKSDEIVEAIKPKYDFEMKVL